MAIFPPLWHKGMHSTSRDNPYYTRFAQRKRQEIAKKGSHTITGGSKYLAAFGIVLIDALGRGGDIMSGPCGCCSYNAVIFSKYSLTSFNNCILSRKHFNTAFYISSIYIYIYINLDIAYVFAFCQRNGESDYFRFHGISHHVSTSVSRARILKSLFFYLFFSLSFSDSLKKNVLFNLMHFWWCHSVTRE